MVNQLNRETQKLFSNFIEHNKTYINIVLQEKDAPFNLDFMTFRRQFIDYIGSIFYVAQTEDILDYERLASILIDFLMDDIENTSLIHSNKYFNKIIRGMLKRKYANIYHVDRLYVEIKADLRILSVSS